MNLIQHLILFMTVFSNKLIISGNEVNISIYYVTDPDVFTGGDFVTECNVDSPSVSGNLTGCPSMNLPRLTDGVTGEGSPLNTDQFVGWDRQSQDTFIIAPEFDSDVPPRQVDIYFHNNPAMGIGLPPIVQVRTGYTNVHDTIGPILFTYANNQHLIQSKSSTTMISVVITPNYTEQGIPPTFSSFVIVFDFTSTSLSQALISEIKVFSEPVNIVTNEIMPVGSDLDLGRDNLVPSVQVSCTVANDGQFSWSWTGPSGAALDPSHTSVLMADLTLTSILKFTNFSISDAGEYICTASMFDGSSAVPETARSYTVTVNAEGFVTTNGNLMATIGGEVSMMCDFSGYFPGAYNITWTGPQDAVLTTSGRHAIVSGDGVGQSKSGGDSPGPSVLSTLTISNVEQMDGGMYHCMMIESNNALVSGSLELEVQVPEPESQVGLIVGVTVGVLLASVAVIAVSLVILCIWVKRRKLKNNLGDVQLYSEVGVKPAPPPLPSYFFSGGASSEYAVITKDSMEMNDIDGSSGLLSAKRGLTRESPQPVKLSNNNIAIPRSSYHDNPVYASTGCLDHDAPSVSSAHTGGSLPTLLDTEDDFSPANFNIYAEAHPPPVPSYHGSIEGSLYEEEIGPALFKKSQTCATNSNGGDLLAPYSSVYSNPQPLKRSEALLEVTEKNICEIKELGVGQFGRVVLANTVGLSLKELKLSELNTDKSIQILVAVKRLKSDAEEFTREAFEKEIKFMARLQHENVVRLLGVCLSKNAFIMMQYMENGDLNQFLRKHTLVDPHVNPLPDDTVNAPVLVYLSLQIASGMRYLSGLHYIHRDLATRNILVGQEFTVKIADFGMSRDLYDSYYYRISGKAILPIRWMANECFYGRFTEKTDVWAFGVTMWEIFMLCRTQPYEGMTDQEVVEDAVKGAGRMLLDKPSSCSEDVYQVMKRCWIHEPEQRISFIQIHQLLEQVHSHAKIT